MGNKKQKALRVRIAPSPTQPENVTPEALVRTAVWSARNQAEDLDMPLPKEGTHRRETQAEDEDRKWLEERLRNPSQPLGLDSSDFVHLARVHSKWSTAIKELNKARSDMVFLLVRLEAKCLQHAELRNQVITHKAAAERYREEASKLRMAVATSWRSALKESSAELLAARIVVPREVLLTSRYHAKIRLRRSQRAYATFERLLMQREDVYNDWVSRAQSTKQEKSLKVAVPAMHQFGDALQNVGELLEQLKSNHSAGFKSLWSAVRDTASPATILGLLHNLWERNKAGLEILHAQNRALHIAYTEAATGIRGSRVVTRAVQTAERDEVVRLTEQLAHSRMEKEEIAAYALELRGEALLAMKVASKITWRGPIKLSKLPQDASLPALLTHSVMRLLLAESSEVLRQFSKSIAPTMASQAEIVKASQLLTAENSVAAVLTIPDSVYLKGAAAFLNPVNVNTVPEPGQASQGAAAGPQNTATAQLRQYQQLTQQSATRNAFALDLTGLQSSEALLTGPSGKYRSDSPPALSATTSDVALANYSFASFGKPEAPSEGARKLVQSTATVAVEKEKGPRTRRIIRQVPIFGLCRTCLGVLCETCRKLCYARSDSRTGRQSASAPTGSPTKPRGPWVFDTLYSTKSSPRAQSVGCSTDMSHLLTQKQVSSTGVQGKPSHADPATPNGLFAQLPRRRKLQSQDGVPLPEFLTELLGSEAAQLVQSNAFFEEEEGAQTVVPSMALRAVPKIRRASSASPEVRQYADVLAASLRDAGHILGAPDLPTPVVVGTVRQALVKSVVESAEAAGGRVWHLGVRNTSVLKPALEAAHDTE